MREIRNIVLERQRPQQARALHRDMLRVGALACERQVQILLGPKILGDLSTTDSSNSLTQMN